MIRTSNWTPLMHLNSGLDAGYASGTPLSSNESVCYLITDGNCACCTRFGAAEP